jgi:N-acetylmuramoyl-L-alanine amidase
MNRRGRHGVVLIALLAGMLAACTSAPTTDRSSTIDHTYTAESQGSRVQFIILHFTWEDWATSLELLTRGPVSSHYLVRDDPVRVYQLVDESRRAFHAGESYWGGHTALNAASIGIEIVNLGNRLAAEGLAWQPYPEAQIDAVVQLLQQIVARHGVRPDRILGHSDIAPLRKLDPGPLFPWSRLADAGLVVWPDPTVVAAGLPAFEAALPEVQWFQARLAEHGFRIAPSGSLDDQTRAVLSAFQMKYRPSRYDGEPDAETAALLAALTAAHWAPLSDAPADAAAPPARMR